VIDARVFRQERPTGSGADLDHADVVAAKLLVDYRQIFLDRDPDVLERLGFGRPLGPSGKTRGGISFLGPLQRNLVSRGTSGFGV
jgi:hypothetical protein